MIKKLTFVLLILTSMASWAQESVVFKTKFKPNKKYKTQVKTTSYTEIEFIADQEIMDRLKSQGVELPIITESETNMSTDIITHELDKNGEFTATMEYGKMISNTTINGKTTTEEKPYSGMKILGKYDVDNKFKVDSIIGEKVSQQMRTVLKTTLESVQQAIKFPEKPMKVGETFTSEIPMTIPMEGMNPISVKIDIEYLLTEIKEGKAFFNIKQTVGLDMSQEQLNIIASGTGAGTAQFDIKENFLTKYQSELSMSMTIKINEKMTMKMKSTTTSEHNVVIE
ncbi:hypothetical protein [uncultured Roseivirga sp.]|uniref:hypothetical protein n=1 Tax=uncultured Roseivirga sp. TaxID=543088 RepID=UPI0030DCF0D5|tara:strand:+ start:7868 stop:8716 length:849 start_codon:yes stop_codon:yes gene_type:complete